MAMKIKVRTSEKCKNEDESAAVVFEQRKKDVLGRLEFLNGLVNRFAPAEDEINEDTISAMDYILDSLDNVIEDTKDATGLE